jgi:general secretion pathway protein C
VLRTDFPDNPCMQWSVFQTWWIRAVTFLVAVLVSGSAVWWGLTLSNSAPWQPSVSTASPLQLDVALLAQALGAGAAPANGAPAAAPLAMQLLGVVARGGGKGYALLAVGDAPPKTYKVGSKLSDGLVLQSVGPRSAQVAADMKGPARQVLELPPLSKP